MSANGSGQFHPKAWTPARTELWKALPLEDRKVLERFVAEGSSKPVPDQWIELDKELQGIEKKSAVKPGILYHMRERGWADQVIESVYAPKPSEKNKKEDLQVTKDENTSASPANSDG